MPDLSGRDRESSHGKTTAFAPLCHNMHTLPRLRSFLPNIALGVAMLLARAPARAQAVSSASPPADSQRIATYDRNGNGVLDADELAAMRADEAKRAKEETIVLNPFEVRTDKDTSYGALNSNAIAAFNMELLKAPVAADIFTEQFMNDVGTTTVEDLLNGYGAGVGQVLATPESDSNNNQPGDRFSVAQVGSRGLTAGATRRDGFSAASTRTSITDSFDLERVEVIKGPQALLFGASGAGGFANTGSKNAKFGTDTRPNTTASLQSRIDQYGSKRWTLDVNYGRKDIAFRFVALEEDQNYRRLFIGAKTHAYYGAFAARLPFNTLLKFNARKTDNNRIIPTRADDLNFTSGTQRDSRNGASLLYLLATNQTGAVNPSTGQPYRGTAINPATGQPYELGPVVNGNLSWDNASSWSGWSQSEDINTETYTVTAESVWTKWLATSLAAFYEHTHSQRGPDGGNFLPPRAFNTTNPFLNGEWANGSTFRMDRNAGRKHAYRASALLRNDLLGGRAKSQTVFGYDLNFSSGGNANYRYYEADANWNLYSLDNPRPAGIGPTAGGTNSANALGRYELGTVYWDVSNGPVKKPYFRIGSRRVTLGGRNYVLEQQNPRHPNYVTPTNPLGLATLSGLPGFSGIGGANQSHYAEENKNYGLYAANYTSWLDERFTTLLGYRRSSTFTRRANTSISGSRPWTDTFKDNSSYNLGLTYQIRPWLYGYYNVGQTFDPAKGSNDPYGEPPPDTEGFSQEIGFKYQLLGGRVSGSLSYYRGESKHENFNYGTGNRDLINPVGINDAFNASQRNQWVALDKQSQGIEIILTAAVTRNWSSRLGFTQQNGTIKTASAFPLLWNDEFHYNKSTGGVTYADGTPFIVPTDAAGVAAVSSTNGLRPAVVGSTNAQLTVAMMSDPNSDYYAYGRGNATEVNGRIRNNSVLFRALRWFQTPAGLQARTLNPGRPISEIPYAYSDPAGYRGVAVLSASGEPTIGHPLYRFVWTNTYQFTEGRLRGLAAGATVKWDHDWRTYWYTEPDGRGGNIRKLYKQAGLDPVGDAFLRYNRKIGRYGFTTQVNIYNVFNSYRVDLRPSGTTGYTNEANIGATFVGEPRQYVWTNTVSF